MIQYLELLDNILRRGTEREDRTGTGTISVFGRQLRFSNLDKWFPLVTTKKTSLRTIFYELKWMLNGGTNIKYLVDNGVNIWNEWPWKHYNAQNHDFPMTLEEFRQAIQTDSKAHGINIRFSEVWGEVGPVYGYQWRKWPKFNERSEEYGQPEDAIDQMQILLDTLRKDPTSRRMIVSAWNVADLEEMAVAGLPPCHLLMQFYTRELTPNKREELAEGMEMLTIGGGVGGWKTVEEHHQWLDRASRNKLPRRYLDCQVYIRSNDCFLGMPFNIAQYAMLTHLIAHSVNMVPGDLVYTTGDTHIYSNHVDQVMLQLQRTPYTPPSLRIHGPSKAPWDYEWEDIQLSNYEAHPHIAGEVAI